MQKTEQKSKFNLEKILDLSKQGLQIKDIAKQLEMNPKSLSYYLLKYNINLPKRRKYMVVDDFFDNIDSEIKAYLLGYFIADGCICIENKKHNGIIDGHSIRMLLNVSEDDSSIIKLFKQYIIPQGTISKTNCQNGVKFKRKPQVKLRWVSNHMFNTLSNYNIRPNKTLDSNFILPENCIPENLWRHLVRGFFDGDGCIYHQKRKGVIYKQVSFVFTSKIFADQLLSKINIKYNISERVGKTCKWYEVRLLGGKIAIEQFKQYLYKDSNFFLQRKFLKF